MTDLTQAKALFLEGVAFFEGGRLDDALNRFGRAAELAPGRPSVLRNLGITHMQLGQWEEALQPLEQALAAEPEAVDAWVALALSRQRLGLAWEALQAFERVRALAPDHALAWGESGCVLRELKQTGPAIACLERALKLVPDHPLYRYYLSALRGQDGPAQPPRAYVESLFDQYAEDFESHLVGRLQYCGHSHLLAHLPVPTEARFARVLDLGCGTGLSAPLIAPRTDYLCGIDLSAGMIEQARRTGLYAQLEQVEAAEFLARCPTTWDLVLATDVFIYVGALEPIFSALQARMTAGAWLAFTAELCEDVPAPLSPRLMPSLRYAHTLAYLQGLAQAHGLHWCAHHQAPLRLDEGRPMQALYAYLRKL
jgi:predicted TPR repeat methyltransferase